MIIQKGEVFLEQIDLSTKSEDGLLWITIGVRKNQSAIKINKGEAIKIIKHLTSEFVI